MLFVTTIIISTLTFAGQTGPWDNDLEASLFIDSPTDIDENGATDVADLLELIKQWGSCANCSGDFDNNDFVNVSDLLQLIDAWGENEIQTLPSITVSNAGVPCITRGPSGELVQMFQWFPNGDVSVQFIARRTSFDEGGTWGEIQSIQWANDNFPHSTPADPSLVLLEDGTWRLYFTSHLIDEDKFPATFSATSTDGLLFEWESGKRMDLVTSGLLDPSIIFFNGEYHFFAPRPGISHGSIYATSTDGITFTQQSDIVVKEHTDTKFLGNPSIIDDQLRFFGTLEPTDGDWGGVFIATSDNAVDWTVTWTNYGEIADPAGIQTSDGILMFVTALYSAEP